MAVPPSLDALDLLVAVADYGSVSAAARACGMAQPNASRMLTRLERALGAQLVERSHAGARLTAAGAAALPHARRCLDAADDLAAACATAPAGARLRVASSPTVAEHLLPRWIAELREAAPGVRTQVDVVNSTAVEAAVLAGRADLGFIESPRPHDTRLRSRVVARDRLLVVVTPGHPWARAGSITAADLAATPLVARERGSGTREALEEALARTVPDVPQAEPAAVQGSAAAVLMSAVAGVAPAVVAEEAAAPMLADALVVAVDVTGLDLRRPLRAVWAGARMPTGPALPLLQVAGGWPGPDAAGGAGV